MNEDVWILLKIRGDFPASQVSFQEIFHINSGFLVVRKTWGWILDWAFHSILYVSGKHHMMYYLIFDISSKDGMKYSHA